MALTLRPLSPEEHETIEKLAHSRTAPARLVERARIMLLVHTQATFLGMTRCASCSQP